MLGKCKRKSPGSAPSFFAITTCDFKESVKSFDFQNGFVNFATSLVVFYSQLSNRIMKNLLVYEAPEAEIFHVGFEKNILSNTGTTANSSLESSTVNDQSDPNSTIWNWEE